MKDITEFFDSMKVDIKSDLSDWKAVKRELLTGKTSEHDDKGGGG